MKPTRMLLFILLSTLIVSYPGFYANSIAVTPLQQLFVIKALVPDVHIVGILVNKHTVDKNTLLPRLKRASAQVGVKVVIAEIGELKDIAKNFRELKNTHHVDTILIPGTDEIIGSEIGKKYLIKQTILNNIPLFAPTREWVSEGALLHIYKEGNKTALFVNKKTAEVLAVSIPQKYLENTRFFAMNQASGE